MAEPISIVGGTFPFLTAAVAAIAIIAVIVAWKVLKFTVRKIFAILQGLVALVLIAFALAGQPAGFPVFGCLVGLGLLFWAISNFMK